MFSLVMGIEPEWTARYLPGIEEVAVRVEVVRFTQFVIDQRDDVNQVLFPLVRSIDNSSRTVSHWTYRHPRARRR